MHFYVIVIAVLLIQIAQKLYSNVSIIFMGLDLKMQVLIIFVISQSIDYFL